MRGFHAHQVLRSSMLPLQARQRPVSLGYGSLEERQPVILEALKGCLCPAEVLHQRWRPLAVGFDKAFLLYAGDRRGSGTCWQQDPYSVSAAQKGAVHACAPWFP